MIMIRLKFIQNYWCLSLKKEFVKCLFISLLKYIAVINGSLSKQALSIDSLRTVIQFSGYPGCSAKKSNCLFCYTNASIT